MTTDTTQDQKNRVEFIVREVLRMSYTDFAKKIGVSRFVVGNWKRRKHFPIRQVKDLSEKTGLPAHLFVDLD